MKLTVDSGPHRAVKTEYRGPTDHRGSRVIATLLTSGKRFVTPWDHALNAGQNHDAAALRACEGDGGKLVRASVDGGGYVYILTGAKSR